MTYKRPNAPGALITFEGGEGSGKSTQIRLLAQDLSRDKYAIIRTREPGGTPAGAKIRRLLLHPDGELTSKAESMLMWADRNIHVETDIDPSLRKGKIVLCDRFSDSSKAYQGYGRRISLDWMDKMESLAIGDFKPDLTFLFTGDLDALLERVAIRNNGNKSVMAESRIDNEERAFHRRVMIGYNALARKEPQRFRVIDAMQSIEFIHGQVYGITTEYLRENYKRPKR